MHLHALENLLFADEAGRDDPQVIASERTIPVEEFPPSKIYYNKRRKVLKNFKKKKNIHNKRPLQKHPMHFQSENEFYKKK